MKRLEISRSISAIENRQWESIFELSKVFNAQSLKKTVCFTGPGGVGKSSLLAQLTREAVKASGKDLAWLACDPSSPVTGGSLLGDRIRLSGQEIDERIFLRSLSTRSSQAFSKCIRDIEIFLEKYFFDVWVETAGSGQTQHEVSEISATTVLILQPETGDEVQWMKSGLRECADLFVVNKSDLSGAESMQQSLIDLGVSSDRVLLTSTKNRTGIKELHGRIREWQKDLDWKKRKKTLHHEHVKGLYMESQREKLLKKFKSLQSEWLKNPYAKASKLLKS